MIKKTGVVLILVDNQDEALAFYTQKLGFSLIKDISDPSGENRWVVVAPQWAITEGREENATAFSLIKARTEQDMQLVGNQSGSFPFAVLITDDCQKTYEELHSRGVECIQEPANKMWGIDAYFKDLYGNVFELVQPPKHW